MCHLNKMFTFYLFLMLNLWGILVPTICVVTDQTLQMVIMLHRHGERTPIGTYKNDPYNGFPFPVEFGQLTNNGKKHQYELGVWFRKRYDHFLPRLYSPKDIYVRSTDVDRTLMSAEALLAGLYPPLPVNIWNKKLKWQPIPVHTVPITDDWLLYQNMNNCPKFEKLFEEMTKTNDYQQFLNETENLSKYVSENTGENITTLNQLLYLFNILDVQKTVFNLTLPQWTETVFPQPLMDISLMNFILNTSNPDLARLKTGNLFYDIISHFISRSEDNNNTPKVLMYSAHDITVVNLLHPMGAFDGKWPPFSAAVIFELHNINGTFYVEIFYKKKNNITMIPLKGCEYTCEFNKFKEILRPLTVSKTQLLVECYNAR